MKSLAYFAQTFAVKKIFIKIYLFLIIFHILHITAYGQAEELSEIIRTVAEELASDESDPEAAATYIERLYELTDNPVNLNSASEEELSRLFFLSDFQVKALADYIHASGRILSVFEIGNIPGFDKETVDMMIPFISLKNVLNMSSDSVRWRNRLLTNFSVRSAASDSTSPGSPWKILTKYKFTSGNVSGGFTAEKDPGEKFFTPGTPLPDFLSANLTYNGTGFVRRVIIGDYSARFGQGTNINSGIRTSLSLTSPGYMSASDEVRPYTSTDENNFFRGIAAEFSIKNLAFSLFYSRNNIDATLGTISGITKDNIENLFTSGIHNTTSLLQKKDAVSEQLLGFNISYNFRNIRVGFVMSEDWFSLPVITANNDPHDLYDFSGDKNNLFTVYYNSLINKILLYGELSENGNKKYAVVQGVSFRPSDRLNINFLYRNYNPGYVSFHGKGPGATSSAGNEVGILGNFTFEAAKHLFISGGCDIREFPWLKYRCSSPSQGIRQEIRARYIPTENLTIETSYNYRLTMTDNSEMPGIPDLKRNITRSVKSTLKYSLSENLSLSTRFNYTLSDPSRSRGILMLQDINYKIKQLPFTIWIRYCIFNTDSWDSRLYAYENDLLFSFSIPALSGEGSRSYVMVKWEINDVADIRVKYGLTSLTEKGTETRNNQELKIQFKIDF